MREWLRLWRLSSAMDRGSVRRGRRAGSRATRRRGREPFIMVHNALADAEFTPWADPGVRIARRVVRRISHRRVPQRSYAGFAQLLAASVALGAGLMAWNAYKSYKAEPFAPQRVASVTADRPAPIVEESRVARRARELREQAMRAASAFAPDLAREIEPLPQEGGE